MLGTDHQIYEKFVGINSIVRIPALRFEITSGEINFHWQGGPLLEMSMKVFHNLVGNETEQELFIILFRHKTKQGDLHGREKEKGQTSPRYN